MQEASNKSVPPEESRRLSLERREKLLNQLRGLISSLHKGVAWFELLPEVCDSLLNFVERTGAGLVKGEERILPRIYNNVYNAMKDPKYYAGFGLTLNFVRLLDKQIKTVENIHFGARVRRLFLPETELLKVAMAELLKTLRASVLGIGPSAKLVLPPIYRPPLAPRPALHQQALIGPGGSPPRFHF